MKAIVVLLFVFCYVKCRKTYPPIDKNANLAFINMEGGAAGRPRVQPLAPAAPAPAAPAPAAPAKPQSPTPANKPIVAPTQKPIIPEVATLPPTPAKPAPQPVKPQTPPQIKPVPVNPTPAVNPITTPGPGSVKQLINFYDSQGKASPIRPYSYSQAVKQG